jgi:predicted negative regulator of RcsB-dependent stress response
MNVYMTEEEQIEKIKEFLKQYGFTIFLAIVIALGGSYVFRYWQQHKERAYQEASMHYETLMGSLSNNEYEASKLRTQKLIERFPNTPYAKMAALVLAKEEVYVKRYSEALKHLQWVMDHAEDAAMQQIARLRAARILLGENKPNETLSLLSKVTDAFYLPVIEGIRGDAYVMMKQHQKAAMAYGNALKRLPPADGTRHLLQMKLADLPASTEGLAPFSHLAKKH